MKNLREYFQGSQNNNWMTSYLYPTIGVIDTVNQVNNSATVRSTKGIIENARLPLPYYSPDSGVFFTPDKGDCCMVTYDSSGIPFIVAFYPLNPIADSKNNIREYPKPHTFKIKTKAGDAISISDDATAAGIHAKSSDSIDLTIQNETDPDNIKTLVLHKMEINTDKGISTYRIVAGNSTTGVLSISQNEEDKVTKLFIQVGNHTMLMEDSDGNGTFSLTIGNTNVIIQDSGDITVKSDGDVQITSKNLKLSTSGVGGNIVPLTKLIDILQAGAAVSGPGAANFTAAITRANTLAGQLPGVFI